MNSEWVRSLTSNRRFILVTGKGGIGKTLLSSSLALWAAHSGLRVLLVEQSAVGQIGPLLGRAGIAHEENWVGNLGLANFTAGGNFKDFITKHLMKSNLLEVLVANKMVHSFFTAIPGFAELMLLGRIYYAVNLAKNPPDLVIMDSYASGHFLSLMTTPDAVIKSGLAGPIIQQTQKVKEWLANSSQCATIYVATPEDLVVSEALDFLPVLVTRSPVKVETVVMNRCISGLLAEKSDPVGAAQLFIKERIIRQNRALETLKLGLKSKSDLKNISVVCLPELGAIEEPINYETVVSLLAEGAY
jgi:anion-transporting  ArsA/GET3 family ATPase